MNTSRAAGFVLGTVASVLVAAPARGDVIAQPSNDWAAAYGNGVLVPAANTNTGQAFDGPEQGLPSKSESATTGNWQFGRSGLDNPASFHRLERFDYTTEAVLDYWIGSGNALPVLYPHPDHGNEFNFHPGANTDAVIRWTSGVAGQVTLTGTVRKRPDAAGAGDGIIGRIYKNGDANEIYTSGVLNTAGGASFNQTVTVAVGDTLDFVINQNANLNGDSSLFTPTITLVPEPSGFGLLAAGALALRRRTARRP